MDNLYNYFEAVVVKHWIPLLVGALGSLPWWVRPLLPGDINKAIDATISPSTLRILAISVLVISFIVSNFLAWKDNHEKVISYEEKIQSLSVPNFQTHYLGASYGCSEGKKANCHLVLILRIDNLGADSSVPQDTWALSMIYDGQEYKGVPNILRANLDFPKHHGKIRRYVPDDALYSKLSHILKRNGHVVGILSFIFSEIPVDAFKEEDTIFKLQFMDIRNQPYKEEISIKEMNKKGAVFLAGLKYPYLVDNH
jgi:hypothetical protein